MMPPQNIFAARMGMNGGVGMPRPAAPMRRPVAPVQLPAQPVPLPNRFATMAQAQPMQPVPGQVPAAPPLAPGASTGTPQLAQNIMQRRLMPTF
jgi:hypothetical protein